MNVTLALSMATSDAWGVFGSEKGKDTLVRLLSTLVELVRAMHKLRRGELASKIVLDIFWVGKFYIASERNIADFELEGIVSVSKV